jgi:hypothetical protein
LGCGQPPHGRRRARHRVVVSISRVGSARGGLYVRHAGVADADAGAAHNHRLWVPRTPVGDASRTRAWDRRYRTRPPTHSCAASPSAASSPAPSPQQGPCSQSCSCPPSPPSQRARRPMKPKQPPGARWRRARPAGPVGHALLQVGIARRAAPSSRSAAEPGTAIAAIAKAPRQEESAVPGAIVAETLTHHDGHGGELVAQSWNVEWAAMTAIGLRSVRLRCWAFHTYMRRINETVNETTQPGQPKPNAWPNWCIAWSDVAEDRRFELLRGCPQHAFQACALGH